MSQLNLRSCRNRQGRSAPRLRTTALLLWLGAALGTPLSAQILPPIYKPLPVEEAERFRIAADSLRRLSSEANAQADALETGSRSLRQNGSSALGRLLEEAQRLTEQVNRLETQARIDALAIPALQEQRAEFLQRALAREQELERNRSRMLFDAEGEGGGLAEPAEIRAALLAQIRADSLLLQTFREEAEGLARRGQILEGNIVAARQRIAALQQQEAQLRAFAAEISSGHSQNEPIAQRLEREARELRQSAERLTLEARRQGELADALRVQADRAMLPVRSRLDAMRFYGEDGRAILKTLVFSLGERGQSGSINSELVSDYIGALRLGVGFVVAEGSSATEVADSTAMAANRSAALERFYAGGGNFVLYSSLPLAFHRSPYHSVTVQTLNKISLDVPGTRYRADVPEVPTNLDFGLEAYATLNSYGGKIKAFGLARSALAIGNDSFYRALERTGGAFPYAQLTAGVEIASAAKILISGAHAPTGLDRELTLTFQVAR